jgi:hypothetical protein
MMTVAALLILILCYGLAGYLTWLQRTPIYLLALCSGHLSSLASPLWELLYQVRYNEAFAVVRVLFEQPIPWPVVTGSGWYYPLPALLVFYLYRARWWFPGSLTGLLTYLVFLLYHLLIQAVGVRSGTWVYNGDALPFGVPALLIAALMAAFISLGVLYALISVWRYALLSMLIALLPVTLVLSLFVHGLLGAPLWIALFLDAPTWAVSLGLVSSLALLAWAVQIMTYGLSRLE